MTSTIDLARIRNANTAPMGYFAIENGSKDIKWYRALYGNWIQWVQHYYAVIGGEIVDNRFSWRS